MPDYVIWRNFLPSDVDEAVHVLARQEALYSPATVNGDPSWRSGRTAHIEGSTEAHAVAGEVLRLVPEACHHLGIDALLPSRCEVQLSCYGDGDFFRTHNDSSSPDAADRVISWVIYLDLVKPRTWIRGQLQINNSPIGIENNMVIFFLSSTMHAVRPVTAIPNDWESRRHTVNGWLRK